jgi:hypothetical protein
VISTMNGDWKAKKRLACQYVWATVHSSRNHPEDKGRNYSCLRAISGSTFAIKFPSVHLLRRILVKGIDSERKGSE